MRNPTRKRNVEKPLDRYQSGKKSINLAQTAIVVGNTQRLQPGLEAADFYLIEVKFQHLAFSLTVRQTVNRPNVGQRHVCLCVVSFCGPAMEYVTDLSIINTVTIHQTAIRSTRPVT